MKNTGGSMGPKDEWDKGIKVEKASWSANHHLPGAEIPCRRRGCNPAFVPNPWRDEP